MNCETQHCKACDVWYRCLADKRQHEKTWKHQRNLGLIPPRIQYVCVLCDTVIKGSNSMWAHNRSKKHRERVKDTHPNHPIYIPLQSQSHTSQESHALSNPILPSA